MSIRRGVVHWLFCKHRWLLLSLLSFSLRFMSCSVFSLAPVPPYGSTNRREPGRSFPLSYDDSSDTSQPEPLAPIMSLNNGDDTWDGTSPTRPWQLLTGQQAGLQVRR